MIVAVTGASGHVGNVLCRELVGKGIEVRAMVHNNEDDLIKIGAEVCHGNILDKNDVQKLCKGVDKVFHLAAKISIDKKDKDIVYNTNVNGTQNVIDCCLEQNIQKLIHFSTFHTYGTYSPEGIQDESTPLVTDSPLSYENSKAEAERRIMDASSKGLKATVLKPTAIIGPFDFQPSYLGQALIKIYQNKLPMLVEGGYDFIDVRDVVNAALQAAEKEHDSERYIISGNWLSLKELSATINKVTGKKTPRMVVPAFMAKIGLPFIHAFASITKTHPLYTAESLDILKYSNGNISNEKAKNELGLNPRPIEESLKDIFEWFQENNLV